jgi:hypothetical protein
MHEHMRDRWERRMRRHFGPGWANLSEEERERFRAGMRQWNVHGGGGNSPASTPAGDGASSKASAPPVPGEQR